MTGGDSPDDEEGTRISAAWGATEGRDNETHPEVEVVEADLDTTPFPLGAPGFFDDLVLEEAALAREAAASSPSPSAAPLEAWDEAPEWGPIPGEPDDGPYPVSLDDPPPPRRAPPPLIPKGVPGRLGVKSLGDLDMSSRGLEVRVQPRRRPPPPAGPRASPEPPFSRESPRDPPRDSSRPASVPRHYPRMLALLSDASGIPMGIEPLAPPRPPPVPGTFIPAPPPRPPRAEPTDLDGMLGLMADGLFMGSGPEGATEIRITLKDELFEGTELRISLDDGKIAATLVPPSREVYWQLGGEAHRLRDRLEERGLRVSELKVLEPER